MKLAILTILVWLSFNAFLIVRLGIADALIAIARRKQEERRWRAMHPGMPLSWRRVA